MAKIIQITDYGNNIHGLDDDGNLWVLMKDEKDRRFWVMLADKDCERVDKPVFVKKLEFPSA